MRKRLIALGSLLALIWPMASQADVGCLPSATFDSIDFSGEVYGRHAFDTGVGFRLLRLVPVTGGWAIAVYRGDGSTAPVIVRATGILNPDKPELTITGSDFRNGETSGPAAMPTIRKFQFGSHVIDPAMNPERVVPRNHNGAPPNIATVEPTAGEWGIGELIIEDIGLADLGPDQTPRLTYLKFSGCLGWNRGYRGPDWRMDAEPGVPDAAITALRQCGFDARTYRPSDRTTKWSEKGSTAYLEPDFQADGSRDIVVPAIRRRDRKAGLALCLRGDNRLYMVGFDDQADVSAFMDAGDYWRVARSPHKPGPDQPRPSGDRIEFGTHRGPGLDLFLDIENTIVTRRRGGE
ncbi:hypothetical protein ACFFUB_10940 [Algimonas porphyrae]|uniref:Uncharacterized protein n=1 Tax=Algimonas porphyrae TaxID=1128113 RepID=A0ABQ5V514_9PROT|nr:hypothetical protein [Algimonas porphyrae]GLQ21367.1 hypothetical protein GCM10007854_23220 [Algimonas porphyrae]